MDIPFCIRFLGALRQRLTEQLPAADCLRLMPEYQALPRLRQNCAAPLPDEAEFVRNSLLRARALEGVVSNAVFLFDVMCVEPEHLIMVMRQGVGSIRHSVNALLYLYGIRSLNSQLIQRELGRLVVKNTFPRSWSAYAAGGYGDFATYRVDYCFSAADYDTYGEGAKVIAQGLRRTRAHHAQRIRAQVQANPNTAIRGLDGQPLTRLRRHQWSQMTWRFGYTTLFDVLAHVVEHDHFQYTDLDGGQQQQAVADLAAIVQHFNDLMELYVTRALGPDVLLPAVKAVQPTVTPALASAA